MNNPTPDRLYIVVRSDLSPGLQIAQAVHAAFSFAHRYPDTTARWLNDSNFIVVCSIPTEQELHDLSVDAGQRGILVCAVVEPDIGDQLTAIALEPGPDSQKLCANLPLALKTKEIAYA